MWKELAYRKVHRKGAIAAVGRKRSMAPFLSFFYYSLFMFNVYGNRMVMTDLRREIDVSKR